jgi:hypothetical protein
MPALCPLLRRTPARAALAALLLGGAFCLSGCEQVAIIRSAPVAANYDQKHGNDPLAAADAAALETGLGQRGQVWTMRFDIQPVSAGDVKTTTQKTVLAGRAKVTSLVVTLVATADATLKGFGALGSEGEKSYLEQLVQVLANAGYTGLRAVRVDVWYRSSHHGTLTFTSSAGFAYKVLDGKP